MVVSTGVAAYGAASLGLFLGGILLDKILAARGDTAEKAVERRKAQQEFAHKRAYGILSESEGLQEATKRTAQTGLPSEAELGILAMLLGTGMPSPGSDTGTGTQPTSLQDMGVMLERVKRASRVREDPLMRALGIRTGMLPGLEEAM